MSPLPTFEELTSTIEAFDLQNPRTSTTPAASSTALLTTQQPRAPSQSSNNRSGNWNGRSQRHSGSQHRSNSGWRLGRNQTPRNQPNWHGSSPFHSQQNWNGPDFPSWTGPRGFSNRPASGFVGPGLWCPTCPTSQHNAAHCPHRYGGPESFSPFAGSQVAYYQDPNTWFPDTGATHHMTGDPNALPHPQPYRGPNFVQLGNGDSLNITSTGTIPISLNSIPFSLRNVFLVPSLRKNLLSVARFTHDNNVVLCFFPSFYRIYDLRSGSLLFQGPCRDGLYPLSLPSPQALTASSSTLWHQRFGHPSSSVLSRLSFCLGSNSFSSKNFCKSCAVGKSTQLPFQLNNARAPTPSVYYTF